jgi:hypothetical protein
MSIANLNISQRYMVLIILLTCALLQPTPSAAFINLQNRDRRCDHRGCRVMLNVHQIVQCRDDPQLIPNLRVTFKLRLSGCIVSHHRHYLWGGSTKIAWTTSINDFDVVWGFLIRHRKIAHFDFAFFDENSGDSVSRFNCNIITYGIVVFHSRKQFFQLLGESMIKTRYNFVERAPSVYRGFCSRPGVKCTQGIIHNSAGRPNELIGDMNLTSLCRAR